MEGQVITIMDDNESFALKANPLSEKAKEDLEFARRTEEALERYDRGEFHSMSGGDFLKELERW